MPRKESNAPTERILRILDDVGTLEDYCRQVEETIIQHFPDQLRLFPQRPSLEAVIQERMRQSITLEQTRTRRAYMQRVRSLGKDYSLTNALTMKDIEDAI
jgi:hypothetical protein